MTQQYSLFSDEDFRPESPFTNRMVCALGTFSIPQKSLQERLLAMGADYKPSTRVSRNVHYVLIGRNAPQDQVDYLQTLAFNGYTPRVLNTRQVDEILSGHYTGYSVPYEISKHLHLTPQHYLRFRADYSRNVNPLYTHELYISPDTQTPQAELYQLLGDRGIYANGYIDETTDVLLISDQTLRDLEEGRSNEVIQYIEKTYNESRSQAFNYTMTTETELLQFLREEPHRA